MAFLEREFPSLVPRYERLYRSKYPPTAYRKELQGMVKMLQDRYGLRPRGPGRQPDGPADDTRPEQGGFSW
jgi:hypothetical protein